MILATKRRVVECQCEQCGQYFDVPRRNFADEEDARYCLDCQRRATEEAALEWLRAGARWP